MAVQAIHDRLLGIQRMLVGVHQASDPLSSASKGAEREAFINGFLRDVLPPIYRFGTGDVVDLSGNRSGQVDVVVENPFSPSLPITQSSPRLYLAEGVAAAIEVKSDLSKQWNELLGTARALQPLTLDPTRPRSTAGNALPDQIPLFAVGYTGWKTLETVVQHLNDAPNLAAILVIDLGLFASKPAYGGNTAWHSAWGLWGMVSCIYRAISHLQATQTDPFRYALD